MRYEFIGGSSKKFWEIFPVDEFAKGEYVVRVKYGRIGTAGQENVKIFSYESGAERYYDEKIREKVKKGYKLKESPKVTFGTVAINQKKKLPILMGTPMLIEKPKPVAPACKHFTLTQINGLYTCTNCKKTVEFDKPQPVATPEFETKVRRYFDMGAA